MTQEQKDKNKIQLTREVLITVKNFQPKQQQPNKMTHVQKETAQLLKEKGFDVEVRNRFYENETISEDGGLDNYNRYKHHWISAPTLHEAADWLRAKGVHVYVTCTYGEWDFSIENAVNGESLHDTYYTFKTHDLALESGIIHALKHYVK